MKCIWKWFSLGLALLILLCFVACTDAKQPTGDPLTPPDNTKENNGTLEGNQPEDSKPEDNKSEDNKPEDNKPEDNKPAFDVQAAENETIVQVPLTGVDDVKSYLRFVYADAAKKKLTNIFAHHDTDKNEYEVTEVFRSLNPDTKDDVMLVLRWSMAHDHPILIMFREFDTMRDETLRATATYGEYNFSRKEVVIDASGTTAYSQRGKNVVFNIHLNPPNYVEPDIINFLADYEYYYEREFEENPRVYSYDLIYSCIGGVEAAMQQDLQLVVPFPWTRIKSVLKSK